MIMMMIFLMTITTMVMSVCLPGIFNFDAHHLRGADFLIFLSISFLSPSSSDGHALWPIPALHPQFLYIFCLSLSLFFSVCLSVSLALSVCLSLSLSLPPPPPSSLLLSTVPRQNTYSLKSSKLSPFAGRDKLKVLSLCSYTPWGVVGITLSAIRCLGDRRARARAVLATWRRCTSSVQAAVRSDLRAVGTRGKRADSQCRGLKAPLPRKEPAGTGYA